MYSIFLYSLVLTTTHYAPLVQSQRQSQRICPIRQCDNCLDRSLQTAPGVGFHLGLTSGTAAVSYNNGSVEDIIHVPGSPEYNALMQDLTAHPDRLRLPPMDTLVQWLSYALQELKRRINLLLGRPGSPNAATLSSMLTLLRSRVESHLSTSHTTIGIAVADGAFASSEEINDALVYAGLKDLGKWQSWDRELNSAYGAYGFGLCSSYKGTPYDCEDEELAFNESNVLHIDYTRNTLAAHTAWIATARSQYAETKFVDWKLGRDEAKQWKKEIDYWNTLKIRIRSLVTTSRKPFTQLLLTGERGNDEKFLEAVKDALHDSELANQVEISKQYTDLTFIVARGASEFQRRRQQGWDDCVQPKHCSETSIWGKAATKAKQALEL